MDCQEISAHQLKRCVRKGCQAFLALLRCSKEDELYNIEEGSDISVKMEPEVRALLDEFKDLFPKELPRGLPPR